MLTFRYWLLNKYGMTIDIFNKQPKEVRRRIYNHYKMMCS